MPHPVHHVFTRAGDGTAQVDAALARLAAGGVGREASGVHQVLYVTRADRTVVMTTAADAPLAVALRELGGWEEPGDAPLSG